ncbi:unnamed protein product [Dovyalis caffra]|uniref:Uncharacterized protein n=1 Tax=Dovyalis caffra TaxID=77055 RepID=A0AAV1QW72_9ROSI|nr:unnamed protein product [Dovyalis caffra]
MGPEIPNSMDVSLTDKEKARGVDSINKLDAGALFVLKSRGWFGGILCLLVDTVATIYSYNLLSLVLEHYADIGQRQLRSAQLLFLSIFNNMKPEYKKSSSNANKLDVTMPSINNYSSAFDFSNLMDSLQVVDNVQKKIQDKLERRRNDERKMLSKALNAIEKKQKDWQLSLGWIKKKEAVEKMRQMYRHRQIKNLARNPSGQAKRNSRFRLSMLEKILKRREALMCEFNKLRGVYGM